MVLVVRLRFWARRAAGIGAMAAIPTSFGCGDETETCLGYACSTKASLLASVPCAEASANFDATLCHDDECSTGAIAWSRANDQDCTGNLAPDAGPDGFQQLRTVCATARKQSVAFTASWDFGKEGVPARKTFRLRVVDASTGTILLDESGSGDFEPGASYDHCHACYHATVELGASSGQCSPSGS